MCNTDIRTAIKDCGIKHWQLADILNISEATMIRKLRHELVQEEKDKILNILETYKRKVK